MKTLISKLFSPLFPILRADENFVRPVSQQPKLVGNEPQVGVIQIRNSNGAAIRIFYPAAPSPSPPPSTTPTPTQIFRNPLAFFFEGYLSLALSPFLPAFLLRLINLLLIPLLYVHPLGRISLPRCADDLPPRREAAKGLIIWSHGLTGTGCEHGLLATSLALKGYVVALPHHSDGSSSLVDIKGERSSSSSSSSSKNLFYKQPDYKAYDPAFRQKQAGHRAAEVEEARSLCFSLPLFTGGLLSRERTPAIVGGFSFGAATAGLVAATNPGAYRCAVLIDGWWNIDLPKHNVFVNLPAEMHDKGTVLPTLFVGSEEFDSYPRMKEATAQVQAKCKNEGNEVHLMKGTRHGNFMDAVFWLPKSITARIGMAGRGVDAHEAYAEFGATVGRFIDKHSNDE